jgi:hypothetical protein
MQLGYPSVFPPSLIMTPGVLFFTSGFILVISEIEIKPETFSASASFLKNFV